MFYWVGPCYLERGKRIELSALAWKAKVLPLYEPRILYSVEYLFSILDAGDRFELPMHLAYETGVVTTLPAITLLKHTPNKCLTLVVPCAMHIPLC